MATLDYQCRKQPAKEPSRGYWRVGITSAAFPYVGVLGAVGAGLATSSTDIVVMLLVLTLMASLVLAVVAVACALIYTVKAEEEGVPEGLITLRRRIIGTLLLAPFVILFAYGAVVPFFFD